MFWCDPQSGDKKAPTPKKAAKNDPLGLRGTTPKSAEKKGKEKRREPTRLALEIHLNEQSSYTITPARLKSHFQHFGSALFGGTTDLFWTAADPAHLAPTRFGTVSKRGSIRTRRASLPGRRLVVLQPDEKCLFDAQASGERESRGQLGSGSRSGW